VRLIYFFKFLQKFARHINVYIHLNIIKTRLMEAILLLKTCAFSKILKWIMLSEQALIDLIVARGTVALRSGPDLLLVTWT